MRHRPTLRHPPRPPTTRRQGRAIDQNRAVRSCIGCRTRRPMRQLVRLTRSTGDGGRTVEVDGASNGRGAWLCRDEDGAASPRCFDDAVANRQFARAWRTSLDTEDIEAIRRAIGNRPTDE